MELTIYLVAAAAFSTYAAYTSAYAAATQYWGLKLTYTKSTINGLMTNERMNHYMKKINVNGLQSAITTRKQRVRSVIRICLNVLFFVIGANLFEWYIPVSTLFGILFVKNTVRQFLPPSNSTHYLKKIISDLEEQSLLYEGKLNKEEKEASDFFIEQLRLNQIPS